MKRLFIIMLMLSFLLGCGLFGTGTTQTKPLTPKAQAVLFMNTYKIELQDLQSISALVNATPAQLQAFKVKQNVLTKYKKALDLYLAVVDANGTPDSSATSQLNDLVNQLVAAGGVK